MSGLAPIRARYREDSCAATNSPAVIGRNANPALIGLNPSTSCRYCVRKKNMPNMPATRNSRPP
jgi:hypothetical protein